MLLFAFCFVCRYFSANEKLYVDPRNDRQDKNDRAYLEKVLETVLQHLAHVNPVPSIPFYERPPDTPDGSIMMQEEGGHKIVQSPTRPPQQMWRGAHS